MGRPFLALLSMGPVLVAFIAGSAVRADDVITRVITRDRIDVTMEAGSYTISTADGEVRLDIGGFDRITTPGSPALPMRRFLIALPPGCRAEAVEVTGLETVPVPGSHAIAAAGPVALATGTSDHEQALRTMLQAWRDDRAAIYGSDAAFPARPVWIAGRGTFRTVPYVSVAFCPFTYHPVSGTLSHHRSVDVSVTCSQVSDGTSVPGETGRDPVGYERAFRLFANFEALAPHHRVDSTASRSSQTYDFVVITVDALRDAVDASAFLGWKSALGHTVRTVLTTDPEIATQPGRDLAEQIRTFLRAHYVSWGIEYVILVGDYATVPMRICYPDPDFHVYNPSNPGLVAPGTPTDYYYADLSYADHVSWDADGDGFPGEYGDDLPDFLAEVAVGRIPVSDPGRITYTLDKLVAFEQNGGAWKRNVLHAGSILFFENQDFGDVPFIDGSVLLDAVERDLMPGCAIDHFTEQAGIVTSYFDWPAISESAFRGAWRDGQYAIVNWSGHGWTDAAARTVWEWDDGDGVPESTNGELQSHRFIGTSTYGLEDDYPSIVFAISCNVGYPDPNPYGNLGIDLLTRPGWGASAGIVSSARPAAISADWLTDRGGTEEICYCFNRCLLVESDRVGDALYVGKFEATTAYGWDRVYEYMNLYNFNLFGDPSLVVDSEVVQVADAGVSPGYLTMRLVSAHPSANGITARLHVPRGGHVRVTVHDVQGRLLTTLDDTDHPAGTFDVTWDGAVEGGRRAPSGVYLVRARFGPGGVTEKLVVVR